jgi:drug/metabolite transporter (DMT)-like permease
LETRKSIDLAAIGLMVTICFIWGIQPIGLKFTASLAAPVLQIGVRSGIAALCVWLMVRVRGGHIPLFGRTAALGATAGLLFALEFFLVGEALRHTSASHVVVFMYTAPIFAAIGLHWKLPSERLSAIQWLGIAIAAGGIAFAFLAPEHVSGRAGVADMLVGDLCALLAGAAWGATTVLIRTTALSATPAPHTLFYQLATAFVLLTAAAFATGQGHVVPTLALLANIAFQSIIVSFLSFLTWFWLLTRYRASQLGVFSFMTPLFGVVAGIVLLDEPLTRQFVIGASGVLAGIIIVSAYPWLSQRAQKRTDRRDAASLAAQAGD